MLDERSTGRDPANDSADTGAGAASVRRTASAARPPASVGDDPLGASVCATAFRKRVIRDLRPEPVTSHVEPGAGSLDVVVTCVATPLNIAARMARVADGEMAARAISTFRAASRDAVGAPAAVSERRGLQAVISGLAYEDTLLTRRALRAEPDDDFATALDRFSRELIADALLAWDRHVREWNKPRRRQGRAPRVIHGSRWLRLVDVASVTGLNEKALRRQCVRGVLPARQQYQPKLTWEIDLGECERVSAGNEAARFLFERYRSGLCAKARASERAPSTEGVEGAIEEDAAASLP